MRALFFLPFLLLAGCAPALPPPVAARQPVAKVPEGVPDGYEVALLDPAAAAQLPKAPNDYKKAPNGLGDFLFGMTVAEAEAKCREVAHLSTDQPEDPLWATTRLCIGPRIMSLPMLVGLHFCKGTDRLCDVSAWRTTTGQPPRTDGQVNHTILLAKFFGIFFERRFGPPTNTRDAPLSDACLEGKPRTDDLPGPYRRNWWWDDPLSHVLAVFTCSEKDRGVYLYAQDADGVRVRVAQRESRAGSQ